MNLEIRKFSANIIAYINENTLPIEVKRLCIKDILNQLEASASEQIDLELKNEKEVECDGKDIQEN